MTLAEMRRIIADHEQDLSPALRTLFERTRGTPVTRTHLEALETIVRALRPAEQA